LAAGWLAPARLLATATIIDRAQCCRRDQTTTSDRQLPDECSLASPYKTNDRAKRYRNIFGENGCNTDLR
jgi:hypothetical protein